MNERDQWKISKQSFHYRIYQWWQRLGGDSPTAHGRPLDLCHYMRVVIFWAWLRWFFCSKLRPWALTLLALFAYGQYRLYEAWPDTMSQVYLWFGVVVGLATGIAALLFVIVKTILWFVPRHAEGLERFGLGIISAVYWVGLKIEAAVDRVIVPWAEPFGAFVGNRLLIPAGTFLARLIFIKNFRGFRLWMLIPPGIVVLLFYLNTKVGWIAMLVIGAAATVAVLVLTIAGLAYLWKNKFIPAMQTRAERHPKVEKVVVEREPSQFWEGVKLIWQFFKAKKQKICPFIVPTDGASDV